MSVAGVCCTLSLWLTDRGGWVKRRANSCVDTGKTCRINQPAIASPVPLLTCTLPARLHKGSRNCELGLRPPEGTREEMAGLPSHRSLREQDRMSPTRYPARSCANQLTDNSTHSRRINRVEQRSETML